MENIGSLTYASMFLSLIIINAGLCGFLMLIERRLDRMERDISMIERFLCGRSQNSNTEGMTTKSLGVQASSGKSRELTKNSPLAARDHSEG